MGMSGDFEEASHAHGQLQLYTAGATQQEKVDLGAWGNLLPRKVQ